MASENGVTRSYTLDRGHMESARLYLQHWIWGQNFGWQLHPEIPRKGDLRIIDVATGNACWLIEVARLLSPKSSLLGVDISDRQFPPKQFLSGNIQLRTLDAFGDIPEDLLGSFDVVHLRAAATLPLNNDPSVLVGNIMKLLRPGGYIQWDDFDCAALVAQSPDSSISKVQTQYFIDHWLQFCAKCKIDYRWVSDIPTFLRAQNALVLRWEWSSLRPELYNALADDLSMGLYDIGAIASKRDPDAFGTAEEWNSIHAAALAETAQGVGMEMPMVVAIARKPIV